MAKSDYKNNSSSAAFTPIAEIFDSIDYLDRVIPLGRANFPRIDSLKVGMAALCGNEFMGVTALGPGTVAVSRGAADTVPAQHPAKALIWFIDTSVLGSDGKEYSAGETTSVKYSPYTAGGGALDVNQSGEIDSVTYNWRFYRPYPPGHLLVRGERWYVPQELSADEPALQLTWTHRDRTIQFDQLVDHDASHIGPEPGTSYTVRVYDGSGTLKRTETGIMAKARGLYGELLPPQWTYTWQQAMLDLGATSMEIGEKLNGKLTIFSTRQGFDSWQGYEIPFSLDTQGLFMKVAQLSEVAARQSNPEDSEPYPPATGLYGAQAALIAAQPRSDGEDGVVASDGLYVAQIREGAGQETNYYTPINRNLFEVPYAFLAKRGDDVEATKLLTVAARPSDRLTDAHTIWTRYDYPAGIGASFEYVERVEPLFTPWITLGADLDYLAETAIVGRSSFYDGISLEGVSVGQVAIVDAEIIRVDAKTETTITIARGCYDTVPARHYKDARVWFFEAMAGNDPSDYPLTMAGGVLGAAAQVKMVPTVFGPPLDLNDVPTDRVDMARRVERPYPPGQVRIADQPWHKGCVLTPGRSAVITWVHRNRPGQGSEVVDHTAPDRSPESRQQYRLSISVNVRPLNSPAYSVTIRDDLVDGDSYTYTAAMAQTDGYRAGQLLGVCGHVTVGLVLESVRDEFKSWQNYVIPVSLPSYACPAGQQPGGGQLPPSNGGGNGDTGTTPGGSPGDNTGDGPGPGDNDNGDNGDGPPPPPEVPPDWPDPIDPPPVDPDDPDPALAGHWDTNWDRHWDAYNKDNEGN